MDRLIDVYDTLYTKPTWNSTDKYRNFHQIHLKNKMELLGQDVNGTGGGGGGSNTGNGIKR